MKFIKSAVFLFGLIGFFASSSWGHETSKEIGSFDCEYKDKTTLESSAAWVCKRAVISKPKCDYYKNNTRCSGETIYKPLDLDSFATELNGIETKCGVISTDLLSVDSGLVDYTTFQVFAIDPSSNPRIEYYPFFEFTTSSPYGSNRVKATDQIGSHLSTLKEKGLCTVYSYFNSKREGPLHWGYIRISTLKEKGFVVRF